MAAKPFRTTVVVPTKNRRLILRETLRALPLDEDIELVVVNDGQVPVEDVPGELGLPRTRVIPGPGVGAAGARNAGARAAQGEFLLFLDDDILVARDHIARHLRAHELHPRAVVGASIQPSEALAEMLKQTAFGRYRQGIEYPPQQPDRSPREAYRVVESLAGFSLSLPTARFWSLDGFDERFPFAGCEDTELSLRARARGLSLMKDTGNLCFHNEIDRLALEPWLERQYTGTLGAVLIAHLYPEGKRHPFYQANQRPLPGEPLSTVFRKVVLRVLAAGPLPRWLLRCHPLLEALRPPGALLFRYYSLLFLVYSVRGFTEGLRRVRTIRPSERGEESGGN